MSEEQVFTRPSPELISRRWEELFSDPLLSLSRLKAAALSKPGLGESDEDGGIILRSVFWRFYHGLLPPPTSLDLFEPSVAASRQNYQNLRERYLVAPDGRWADDCTGAESYQPPGPSRSVPADSWNTKTPTTATFDPLSLDEDSPWKTWYAHLDTRKVIMQDVDRTFPDIPYFTLERVKRCMVTMLFLFTVLNPDVGYRQGMHELLAVCLLTVDRDSLERVESKKDVSTQAMGATLDRHYVEHDAFDLFMAIMKPAKAFYEWRQEEGPKRAQSGQAPIIIRSNNLHSSLIRRIDPQMWERLENEGIEAQLWAMRWYKLIFTRELPFSLALRLWDGIFAEDSGLGLLDFICVAMLLLIRNELLDSDHAGLLTNLLRYPAPSPLYPFSPFLILSQALLLRNSITPTTGVEVVIQNNDILGVRAAPPVREPEQIRSMPKAPQRGVQGLAAGLFERAQAAGLDKAILSTVADIRRNIPDSAYSYLPNLPFSPQQPGSTRIPSGPFSSIPSSSFLPRTQQSALPSRSPIPAPSTIRPNASTDSIASVKTLRDAERELAELRLAMVGMGKAMSEWLNGLPESTGQTERDGLERVKETLLDAAGKDVDDIVKEWGWHDGLETASSRAETPISTPGSPAIPLTQQLMASSPPMALEGQSEPGGSVPAHEGHGKSGITGEEVTPTPRAVDTFTSPVLPSNPYVIKTAPHPRAFRQPIYTGTQSPSVSGPSRSPPRTAPLPQVSASHTQPRVESPITSPLETGDADDIVKGVNGVSLREIKHVDDPLDPLAGLGVTVGRPGGIHTKKNKSGGVDPLLGVGLR